MSTAPANDVTGGISPNGLIQFTQRGEDALDALATELAARCDGTPEGIAELLDQVLHADTSELADSLTAPSDQPLVIDAHLTPTTETPDESARRRLGRPQHLPHDQQHGPITVDPPLTLRPSATELAAGTAP